MAGSHYPYTLQEDRIILRYILDGHYEAVLGGNAVWKQMDEEDICPGRSWQSLKNRFKRNIKADFSRPEFGLTRDEKRLLKLHCPSKSLSDVSYSPKRKVDPRLISRKIQKMLSNKKAAKENKPVPLPSHQEPEVKIEEPKVEVEAPKIERQEQHVTLHKKSQLPKKKKEFYSLGVEWSDSDSD